MLDAGCKMLDAGCKMRDAGCKMRDAGCWMQDTGYGMMGRSLSSIESLPLSLSAPCLRRGRLRRGLFVAQGKKTKKLRRSDLSRRFGGVASEEVAPTELTQKRAVCYKQVAPTGLEKPNGG